MKKSSLFLFLSAVLLLAGCQNGPKKAELIVQNDSLQSIIAQRDAALDEMIASINVVQEGFQAINESQGRIQLDAQDEKSNVQKLQDEINFIGQTMEQNKVEIEKLQKQLANSQYQSKQLKKMIEKLQTQLQEKGEQIASLQSQLAEKNIRIEQLDKTVGELSGNVTELEQKKTENEQTIAKQDAELHNVWYAMGTKRELKEQKIIDNGEVLQGGEVNKSYFTQADMRTLTTIDTHSKSAKILTTHPENSYKLTKNDKKEYVLTITHAKDFWSVSRYLVIQVR